MTDTLPQTDDEKTASLYVCITPQSKLNLDPIGEIQAQLRLLEDMENRWLAGPAKPVGNTKVANMLHTVADTLRLPRLKGEPLAMYQTTLKLIPEAAFEDAWRNVLATHTYKSMPTPAEFLAGAKEKSSSIRSMLTSNAYYRRKLEAALHEKMKERIS